MSDIADLSRNEIEKALKAGTCSSVLSSKADPWNRTPLMLSIVFAKPCVFKLLLKYGADVNKTDIFNQTILHYASRNITENYLRILLHYRSFYVVDCIDMDGITPLAKAIATKSYGCAHILLDAGAKISNVKNIYIPHGLISLVQKRNQIKRKIILFLALSKKTKAVHKDLLNPISKMVWELRDTKEKTSSKKKLKK